jgi:uncharacterized membrane protein
MKHLSKCLLAGIVAILPIAGTVLILAYLESEISSSGISKLSFYFPGMGLILAFVVVYLVGLVATTLAGQWLWRKVDRAFHKLPAIGKMYVSLKQILGYGEGEEAVFRQVVEVSSSTQYGTEIGLVTNEFRDPHGNSKFIVFIPSAPNPTSGRMVILSSEHVKYLPMTVHEALKLLVTIGKSEAGMN